MENVASAPKAALKFASARPIAFGIMALVVILVTLRFSTKIRGALVGLPVVGKVFAKVVG